MWVPRRVRKIPDQRDGPVENPVQDLAIFRSEATWVLLGEPGAGKTTAFQMEADATDGQVLSINEFINLGIQSEWRGKTLFLDGLDEVRAGRDGDSILQQVRQQLKHLGNPPFRIACRAADWHGSTDRADIENASPDGRMTVLLLEPLNNEDILNILRENHGIDDPDALVRKAAKLGIADLLDNPQTLKLLAKAVGDGRWPKTRVETYQLACEKLAMEANKRHRDKKRGAPLSAEKVLDAAGQLCAVLLFSDKTGLALDAESAAERFPDLADCAPPDTAVASQAIGSKLFRPAGEERVVPSHRSIAEFLAARWLGRRIDNEGLPQRRVLNLLLGVDGGVVAGLRGLFGWLALHCRNARLRLIDADPLTVVVYGDAKPMPSADKRRILAGLRREAEHYAAFRWDAAAVHPFGALADAELHDDFLSILQAPERDDASQSLAVCVLDILTHGEALPEFAPILLAMVRDDTRSSAVRKNALQTWLKLSADPQEALTLLDDLAEGRVTDPDDELIGTLLRRLYPVHLDPKKFSRYLHFPKIPNLSGTYAWFWEYDLLENAPNEHLPALLDALVDHPVFSSLTNEYSFNQMADVLLARGVTIHGDQITDTRLFAWLGIRISNYGFVKRGKSAHQVIADWLNARPERYKAMLALCFEQCKQHENPIYCIYTQENRLHGAQPPDDIGLWHLEQTDLIDNEVLSQIHLSKAVQALAVGRGTAGLSLERLEAWGATHPEQKHWLDSLLVSEIPNWRTEEAARDQSYDQQRTEEKRKRTIAVTSYLPAICTGTAHFDLMHQLASLWMKRFIHIPGETPIERFDNYCENGGDVLTAAETGFRLCLERQKLPTVEEIIDLHLKQREHLIRLPCLVGMELRWRDGPGEIERLSDETLRRMIAFLLTYHPDNPPAWFKHLVQQRATLVAEVLVTYASASLKAGKDHIDSIYPLEHDPEYRAVATLAAPPLLKAFPVRARAAQLPYLNNLLAAVLHYKPEILQALAEKKLGMKGMDIAQKVYWHAIATLLDPANKEAALWRCVGKSEVRAKHLAGFLVNCGLKPGQNYELTAKTMGRLIELITPQAQIEWPSGLDVVRVTDALRYGDLVRALINRLGRMPTAEAAQEIERLLEQPTLRKLKPALESARYQQKIHQRENQFRFLSPPEVARILANQVPASVADLAALALDHLDDIARAIRQDNDDGFRAFWTETQPNKPKKENSCRDVLLTRLGASLTPLDIDCQPEGDYSNDKRADIRLSYHAEFELPIEIKRDSNPSLWEALQNQLINQYAIAPRADGHGIYLVLWFGGEGMPRPTDGGKKPRSPEELKTRLEAQLSPIERQRIFVRVFDVSWPVARAREKKQVERTEFAHLDHPPSTIDGFPQGGLSRSLV